MWIDGVWWPRAALPLMIAGEGDGDGAGGGGEGGDGQGATGSGDAGDGSGSGGNDGQGTSGTGSGAGGEGAQGGDGQGGDGQGKGTGSDGQGKGLRALLGKGDGDGDGEGDKGTGDSITLELQRGDLPETFLDKDGNFKFDSLVKSWKDQQAEISRLQQGGKSQAPDKPEDYDYALTADQQANADKVFMKVGPDGKKLDEDPIVAGFRKFAHENGIGKPLFEKVIQFYVDAMAPFVPDPVDQTAEMAKLGGRESATKAMEVTDRFGQALMAAGHFDKEAMEEFKITTESAAGIKMIAGIRDFYGEKPIPTLQAEHNAAQPDAVQLNAKIGDVQKRFSEGKITSQQADAEMAALDKEAETVFGTQPSGSSTVPAVP